MQKVITGKVNHMKTQTILATVGAWGPAVSDQFTLYILDVWLLKF